MRLAFLGTPEFVVPVLEALVANHEVTCVVTRADRRRSRRGPAEPSPVKAAAQGLGLPIVHRAADALSCGADLGVVVAFGRIIRPAVLERLPMVNLHLSLLPRWRGAAPVQRAILAGDTETGVCLMQLEEGLDTGPIHGCTRTAIEPVDTTASLTERLIDVGIPLLLDALAHDLGAGRPQQGEATYAEKITADDVRLVWDEPASVLERRTRVGGAWAVFRGKRLGVGVARIGDAATLACGELAKTNGRVHVGTGDGSLELVEVKPEGRRDQAAADWWNGARPAAGERLE